MGQIPQTKPRGPNFGPCDYNFWAKMGSSHEELVPTTSCKTNCLCGLTLIGWDVNRKGDKRGCLNPKEARIGRRHLRLRLRCFDCLLLVFDSWWGWLVTPHCHFTTEGTTSQENGTAAVRTANYFSPEQWGSECTNHSRPSQYQSTSSADEV